MTESELQPILVQAFQLHQAGRLAQAEPLYRQILRANPNHPNALHLLGILAHQAGRHDAAVELIGRAVALRPSVAEFHSNLGLAFQGQGRLDFAAGCFRQAVALKPDFATAHNNLGTTLKALGELEPAIAALRRALELKPDYAEAHNNLGNALQVRGDLDEAVAAFRAALVLAPQNAITLNNLGNTLRLQGKLDEAAAILTSALAANPNFAEARHNLANTLLNQGRLEEAAAAFREALRLKPTLVQAAVNLAAVLRDLGQYDPALAALHQALELSRDHPDALNTLGTVLAAQGKPQEAAAAHRRALAAHPHHVPSLINLGNALRLQGDLTGALDNFRAAAHLRPDCAEAHAGLGSALLDQDRLDDAAAALREALRLKPDNIPTLINLGNALKDMGELDDAIAAYRTALHCNPADIQARSNLIYALHFHPDAQPAAILDEARQWDALHAQPLAAQSAPHAGSQDPDRPLRIGYVSADFRNHPIGHVFLPLARCHDRAHFRVICYSTAPNPDTTTDHLRALADQWHDVAGTTPADLAAQIRRDQIDILVELSNHLAGNRLLTFARKPAPIQVAMLNSPMTTGLRAIDYRLSDPHLDPPSFDAHYSEETIRLPNCYFCREMPQDLPDPGPPPAIANGYATFASLNTWCKVTPQVQELWARIMQATPHSRLIVRCPFGSPRRKFLDRLAAHRISEMRIEFLDRVSREDYLRAHQRIDIYLDPFPYCGHTTSLDALSMGVPLITLAGNRATGRAGALLLATLGMHDLIATSPEQYHQIAVALAHDLPRLTTLRAAQRARLRLSTLTDSAAYVTDVEAAFRVMWRRRCNAMPPQP